MRCTSTFRWLTVLGMLLGCPSLWGQTVKQVSATQEAGQTVVRIEGDRLERPSLHVWRNQYLVLEFRARLAGKAKEERLNLPHATRIRYGWYTSNPPRVRVVVTLRGNPPTKLEPIPNGWVVRIGSAEQTESPKPETPQAQPKPAEPVQVATTEPFTPAPPPAQPPDSVPTPQPRAESRSQRVETPAYSPPDGNAVQVIAVSPPRPRVSSTVSLDFVGAEIGDVLKALAIQSGANIVTAPDVKGTITISLNRVTVEEALNLITRLSGYQYERIENTYVVGTAESISAFRKPEVPPTPAPRTTEMVMFHRVKPSDVALYLSARFPELKVTPATDKEANFLLIEGDPVKVAEARAEAYAFEQRVSGGTEIVTEVYRVRYADSRDLVRILAQLVPNLKVALGPDALLTRTTTGSGLAGAMAGTPSPTGTESTQTGASSGGTGSGEQPPNLLVLMGTPAEIQQARTILEKVDVKQPQVLIEARVMDVSEDSLRSFGISWGGLQSSAVDTLDRSQGDLPLPSGGTPVPNQQGVRFNRDGQLGLDISIVKKPIDFTVTLNALADDRRNRLLANPRVATLDGRNARIFIGDEINYVKVIQQTPQGVNVQTDKEQAGIILDVLPRVHEDGSITLEISPEVSVITGFLQVPGGGSLPQVARRNAKTTIRVNNGETVIIGGLIREADIRTIQKVPLLGDLPFLGYFFRRERNERTRSEVIITITVRLMD